MAEERKSNPAKEQNRRRIYVAHRLPMVAEELGKLKTERKSVQSDLKSATEAKKKGDLRKKQIYIAMRMSILREEKKSMSEERKTMKASKGKQN